MITEYSSTFPPTTVAATTAMESGLFPNQSSWLGWTGYFPEIKRNVLYFYSTDEETGKKLDLDIANTYVPYINIREQIQEKGIATFNLAPFVEPYPKTYDVFCREIQKLCEKKEQKYIYAYWDEPDHTMHENGIYGEDIHEILRGIEEKTQHLSENLTDTLILITADHGHLNTNNRVITDYPDVMECLERLPSMEPRALNFFVKEGKEEEFTKSFQKHFGEKFMLMSKAEVLESNLLGEGRNHSHLDGMLGDYLAVAVDDMAIYNREDDLLTGGHAGMTETEMKIPLIAISR